MKEKILKRLGEFEAEHGFRILYACESGSRAWGFASADSDYDVRFIYAWPREKYLEIFEPTEQMDWPLDADELDFSAWELRKALRLFRKSNGALMEWLFSPMVYREDQRFMSSWRDLALEYFVPKNSVAHYLGLSRGMWARMHEADSGITAKKILYVLRSLLAARYIVEDERPIPVEFATLRDALHLPGEVTGVIEKMVAAKAGGSESDEIEPSQVLEKFVDAELIRLSELGDGLNDRMGDVGPLNEFFREAIESDKR